MPQYPSGGLLDLSDNDVIVRGGTTTCGVIPIRQVRSELKRRH
jgi:hypothetical protein